MAKTDRIENDAKSAVEQGAATVAECAATLAEDVKEVGNAARRAAVHGVNAARDTAQEYLDQGRVRAQEMGDTVSSHVRDQPMKSVLIASAIGFLLGVLWIRR